MKKLLVFLFCFLPIMYAAFMYASLPEIVPIHFNISGHADGFGSKKTVWILALLPSFITFALWIVNKLDPKRKNYVWDNKGMNFLLIYVIPIAFFSLYILNVTQSGEKRLSLSVMYLFVSALFILLGNYMPTLKPNYFIGIKTPWTLHNDVVWRKTHRIGGYLSIAVGLLIGILFFLPCSDSFKQVAIQVLVVGYAISTMGVSYFIYRKHNKESL